MLTFLRCPKYCALLWFFFLRVYLFIHERERWRHRQREKQALCRESDAGLNPRTLGPQPEPKAGAQPLGHLVPTFTIFNTKLSEPTATNPLTCQVFILVILYSLFEPSSNTWKTLATVPRIQDTVHIFPSGCLSHCVVVYLFPVCLRKIIMFYYFLHHLHLALSNIRCKVCDQLIISVQNEHWHTPVLNFYFFKDLF